MRPVHFRLPARRPLALVLGGVVLAGTLGLGLWSWRGTRGHAQSEALPEGVWDASSRVRARDAFEATRLPYAAETWTEVDRRLAAYRDALQRRGRITRCLRERAEWLSTLTGLLAQADAETVEGAIAAATALPALDACDRPDVAGEPVTDLTARAIRARVLESLGKSTYAIAVVTDALERARSGPVEAVALATLARGRAERAAGRVDAAEQDLFEAHQTALGAGRDGVAADAALELAVTLAPLRRRSLEAQRWADVAAALARRTGGDRDLELRRLITLGQVRLTEARHRDAREILGAALEGAIARFGEAHPTTIRVLGLFSVASGASGDLETEYAQAARALALARSVWGPSHPEFAGRLMEVASALCALGRYREALDAQSEALRVRARTRGPSDPLYVASLNNLGHTLLELGRHREALAAFEGALARHARTEADAWLHLGAARALGGLGRYEEALARLQTSRSLLGTAGGRGESLRLSAQAEIELARGRPQVAQRLFEQAAELARPEGSTPASAAGFEAVLAHAGMGETLLALGQRALARDAFARAQLLLGANFRSPRLRVQVARGVARSAERSEAVVVAPEP